MMSMQNGDVDDFHCECYLVHMMRPEQCRAARAWLDWKREALASASGVGLSTIQDFENGKRAPIAANLKAMQTALEHAGIVFADGDPLGISFIKAGEKL